MEILTSALGVFLNWEIYVLCAISMVIYLPYSIWWDTGNKLTPFRFFGAPFIAVLLQAFATIFLFVAIFLVVYPQELESFKDILLVSLSFSYNFTDLGLFGFFVSLAFVSLLLILFGDNDFDFLIGIFIFSWITYGDLIPSFPNISTVIMIIGAALFNLYISPIAILPINKVLGDGDIGEGYQPNILETIAIQYVQKVVGLLPALIYFMWLTL